MWKSPISSSAAPNKASEPVLARSLMQPLRHLLRLLVPLACGLLASCIDGREEFWLAGDGSGRAQLRYEVPATLARGCGGEAGLAKLLDEFIRNTPTLTNATRRVSTAGDRLVVDFRASFKSALDLIEAVSGDSALSAGNLKPVVEPLIGHFDFRRSGLRVNLTRTVRPSKALPGSFLMPVSQFEGRHLVYILHLPMVAQESNATRSEDGGRTLIWEQTLQDGLKNGVVIHFKGAVPIPWWLTATAAAVLAGLGWWGWRVGRRRRR